MSTRCNVLIKDCEKEAHVYHHHDGYFEGGVGEFLVNFFNGKHAKDFKFNAKNVANELVGIEDDEFEHTTGVHGDIEYLYVVDVPNETLEVIHRISWYEEDDEQIYFHSWKLDDDMVVHS